MNLIRTSLSKIRNYGYQPKKHMDWQLQCELEFYDHKSEIYDDFKDNRRERKPDGTLFYGF